MSLISAGKVGKKNSRAFQHADQHDGMAAVLSGVLGGDLFADLADTFGDLSLREENLHGGSGWEVEGGRVCSHKT